MEINDKRKFTADGERTAVAVEEATPSLMAKLLAEVPCVYDDPMPMAHYVFVRQGAAQTNYAGTNFLIPETARESPNDGVVVAVGPEVKAETLKPGDLVTFGRFNAEPIEIDGEVFQNVSLHDIKVRRKVTYAVHA